MANSGFQKSLCLFVPASSDGVLNLHFILCYSVLSLIEIVIIPIAISTKFSILLQNSKNNHYQKRKTPISESFFYFNKAANLSSKSLP